MAIGLSNKRSKPAAASVFKSAAFDVSSSAMMLVDRDLKVQFVNAATVSLLTKHKDAFSKLWPGFNPDAMIGVCIDTFHKNPAHQRAMLSDPSRLPYKTDISVQDIKIELNVSAIYDEKGIYVGNTLTWEDVTQRRSNDGVLAALDRGKALIEFNLDGTILTANENFCRTVGYSRSELVGMHHSNLVAPEYARSEDYRTFWKELGAGRYQAGKFKRVGKGGRTIWIDASYNPIMDGLGRPFKVVKLADDITEVELQREQFERERISREQEQQVVVSGLAAGLSELARGNLTYQIDVSFPGTYEGLKSDFNKSIAQLCDAMQRIAQTAEGIRSEAHGINSSSDNLAMRTEQQAASLEQTAAALEEVTTTVKSTANASRDASQAMATAKKDANVAEDVMEQTLSAMGQIESSSTQIANIIGVMEEIAFQTNLLALNAGVEAVRAGDAGRGFAVVASEVRALAQRSSDAAREIKALISTSTSQISAGGRFVRQAGDALSQIVQKVIEVNGLVENIAGSANEQAVALSEVNTAVNQMDQFTQQNAAMVEETTAASHSLSQESQELARLIAQFKLAGGRERASYGRADAEAQSVVPVRKSA